MKKITAVAFVVCMMILMASVPVIAQDMGLKANFSMSTSFYAGGAKMPAGSYSIRQSQEDQSVYVVQNSSGSHQVLLVGQSSSATAANGKADIVFNRYGTSEYLVGADTATGTSVSFDTGTAEKMAAKKGTPQKHTVPAK